MSVLFGRVRDNAIGRREQLQFSHVRIIGREQHADISGDAGHYDAPDAERLEQGVERGVKESRVLRFQDEVVAFRRPQAL